MENKRPPRMSGLSIVQSILRANVWRPHFLSCTIGDGYYDETPFFLLTRVSCPAHVFGNPGSNAIHISPDRTACCAFARYQEGTNREAGRNSDSRRAHR